MAAPRTTALLRHLFFRRFLENDLISPEADYHVSITMVIAALMSSGMLVTVLLCIKYLIGIQLVGPTAVQALTDRMLYIAVAMFLAMIVAALIWDTVALEPRDEAVLGPLPLSGQDVVRAKLEAILLFASVFAVAVTVVPSVLYPVLVILKLPVGFGGLALLVITHFGITLLAFLLGFFAVVACRALLQALLPSRWFRAVSPLVQGATLLLAVIGLLLVPRVDLIAPPALAPEHGNNLPPVWFLSLQETISGHVIAAAPAQAVPQRLRAVESRTRALYQQYAPWFRHFAPYAIESTTAVGVVAIVFLIATNRFPLNQPPRTRPRWRILHGVTRLAAHVLRHRVALAAFLFTLHVITRSARHRITLIAIAALALPFAIVALVGLDAGFASNNMAMKIRLLTVNAVLVGALVAGFRYALMLPADLQAHWSVEVSWTGEYRHFLNGVSAACFICFVCGPTMLTLPVYAIVLGPAGAVQHIAITVAAGLLVIDLLFVSINIVPFTSAYVSKLSVPALIVTFATFVVAVIVFGWIEAQAVGNFGWTLIVTGTLVAALFVTKYRAARDSQRLGIFQESEQLPTQRLGLIP